MSTHNIGFYEDLTKIIFVLSSNTHLISSTARGPGLTMTPPSLTTTPWRLLSMGQRSIICCNTLQYTKAEHVGHYNIVTNMQIGLINPAYIQTINIKDAVLKEMIILTRKRWATAYPY